jgi:tRNA-specific 2-thiouridylase
MEKGIIAEMIQGDGRVKVAILMSGGIDSTVSALLLREQGYEVTGLTMVHLEREAGEKAARIANELKIEHKVVDLREAFQSAVADYFCTEYEQGHTPNPCVKCNEEIKFGLLLKAALDLGADKVASGHYARIDYDDKSQCHRLMKGLDPRKDQSYFLYRLKQQQLSRLIFPLGGYRKEEVREIARCYNLQLAEEKESQEVCFIPGDYREFIRPQVSYKEGSFLDRTGKVLGRHRGIPFYTIGQRRGLAVNAGRPLYVLKIDPEKNQILLGENEELFSKLLRFKQNHFICPRDFELPIRVKAKIRYAAREAEAILHYIEDDIWELVFEEAQRAATPGQSVVYYQGDYVLGGGTIMA